MTTFALASEYHLLGPRSRASVTHIIADDGTWDQARLHAYIAQWAGYQPLETVQCLPDDWTKDRPL